MKDNNCDIESAKGALKVLKVIGFVILGIAAAFLFGLAIMLLWNWLMPMIFGLTTLTYWQAVGVLVLASLLFGRFGSRSGDGKSEKKKNRPVRDSIKEEIKKEFEKEFKKEFEGKDNENYDDMYDKWWSEEGESRFEEYMASKKSE